MEVINQCSNPPSQAIRHLRRSLRWISPSDLEGLQYICLVDALPEPNDESEESYKRAIEQREQICGWYSPKDVRTASCITLNVKDIYRSIPRIYWWTMVPTLLIARTLGHEVAHHLAATRGYVFKRGENLKHYEYEEVAANRYAFYLVKRMEERWYYRFGRWLIRDLADRHHIKALLDWREKKYARSADHWYRAWCLNPELDEAAYWYLRAKKMSSSDQSEHTPAARPRS